MKHKNAVPQGLENMKKYYGRDVDLWYSVNNINYTTDQIIQEIKNETEIGNKFSQMIYDTIISYMGKFGDNDL